MTPQQLSVPGPAYMDLWGLHLVEVPEVKVGEYPIRLRLSNRFNDLDYYLEGIYRGGDPMDAKEDDELIVVRRDRSHPHLAAIMRRGNESDPLRLYLDRVRDDYVTFKNMTGTYAVDTVYRVRAVVPTQKST